MRLSRTVAAAAAPEVYSTGRLRCTSALLQLVAASVMARASTYVAALPRATVRGVPLTASHPPSPTTPNNATSLTVPAARESAPSTRRSTDHKADGSQGTHGGGRLGSFRAAGSSATTPAPAVVAASPQP